TAHPIFNVLVFILLIRRPTRFTLFPYTTLFRSYEPVYQIVPVHSNQTYSLKAYVRSQDITSTSGLCLRVSDTQQRGFEDASKGRSEEHTSELQSLAYLVCRLLLEKKKTFRCKLG